MTPHLPPSRLGAPVLERAETEHVDACVRCRANRRVRLSGLPGRRRVPRRIGPYRVEGFLGSGGMAEVYAARHQDTGRACAVKVVALRRPGLAERLAREARVQARVDHPNVLPLLEVLDHEGCPALVLPRIDGPSLDRLLTLHRPTAVETTFLFAGIVEGVAAIHLAGLVHRDLKPGNVLLDPSSGRVVPRVADFGLAKGLFDHATEDALTASGVLLGTPAYAAPEQLAHPARIDPRADVWALGAVLHELVTGRRHVAGEVLDLPSGSLAELARQLLRLDPRERPADAGQVRALLEGAPTADALVPLCRELAPVVVAVELLDDPIAAVLVVIRSDPTTARSIAGAHRGAVEGDADRVIVRFTDAADAHPCAEALQAAGPVAIGLFVGSPGATPRAVESLAALAGTGQILAVGGAWTDATPLGSWVLDGLDAPVELVELGAPLWPPADRPRSYRVVPRGEGWVAARELPRALPEERDEFVGRAGDLRRLAASLHGESRIHTLVGPAGTGKTRLALRYGHTRLVDWPGGVWFCDLSEARTLDGVVTAVGRALDIPLLSSDPVARLGNAISARGRCLVVLDNFEQVVTFAATTIGRWLESTSSVFLTTSRVRLGLPGEQVIDLAPMDADEGTALFLDRASAQGRPVAVVDVPTVRELVQRLDGLPLAIELAAARVPLLSVHRILALLDQRFALLAVPGGGRADRRSTLRAALDWSWDLLEPWERIALAQLSVFDGGIPLVAVEEVLDLSSAPGAPWVYDVLGALVERSLARRIGEDRLALLASVREYAGERLPQLEAADLAEARHGRFFARGPWRDEDLENVAAAARRAMRRHDVDVVGRCADAATWVLVRRGPMSAALGLVEDALRQELPRPQAVKLLANLGEIHMRVGRTTEAEAALARGWALASADPPDPHGQLAVLQIRGSLHHRAGRLAEARRDVLAALDACRALGEGRLREAYLLDALGLLDADEGRLEDAARRMEEAVALARANRGERELGNMLHNVGVVHSRAGRPADAAVVFADAIALLERHGYRIQVLNARCSLGLMLSTLGRTGEARVHLEAALGVRELGDRRTEGVVLGNLACLDIVEGKLADGIARLETALALHRESRNPYFEAVVQVDLGEVHLLQGRLARAREVLAAGLLTARAVGAGEFAAAAERWLALVDLAEGRRDEAGVTLRRLVEEARTRSALVRSAALRDLSRWQHAIGDAGAVGAVEEAAELLAGSGDRLALATVDADRALLWAEAGRIEEGRSLLEQTARDLREAGAHLLLGVVEGRLGALLARQGDPSASEVLARAEATQARLGLAVERARTACERVPLATGAEVHALAEAAVRAASGLVEAEARALCVRARVRLTDGDRARAREDATVAMAKWPVGPTADLARDLLTDLSR